MVAEKGIGKRLPQIAIAALLNGRYASVGGSTPCERGQNLHRIAAPYSRDELLAERGVGPWTAEHIERWLIAQGLALRCPEQAGVLTDDGADADRA